MNVLSIRSILIIAFILAIAKSTIRYSDFQLRRPIKYYFHLLQMKSQYNPLLYPTTSNHNFCSSKLGPFCSITGHKPLKTHDLKVQTTQTELVRRQLQNNAKYGYQTYLDIEKSGSGTFLIRSALTNSYEMILKNNMGPIHQQNMLDQTKFEEIHL